MTVKRIAQRVRRKYLHTLVRMRAFWERRTRRERLWIVIGMLLLFAALDIWQLCTAWDRPVSTEHIQSINTIGKDGRE
ncbi:MAG: hypothetical protein LUC96_01430 [Alistipes sp.]|uniref:hypothetical protein n=1 Tax=Alistipes sp. TaxID=1872444 RepID=UPI0025C06301|nr:hypothetical protein [Alistipes sp.]MCD8273642.1 hypothetical protein [Alistipes sp.]